MDERQVPNSGELRQSGEPTYSDMLRAIGIVSKSSELGVLSVLDSLGELCFVGKVPNSGELLESGEPTKSGELTYIGGLRSISNILKFGKRPKSG